ncbi:MAG: phosphoribosylformylglycinamidine cyclo-ligase [Anaerolineales bacterium]|nr:phosphoribosylformylglycinamidine cyclo-ligase [Anaerolineales bacterium]
MENSLYRQAGVDIDAGNRAVELMKSAVQSTYTPAVLAGVGGFGGLFALHDLPAAPVLVSSIDGVGTKVKLAAQLGRWEGIGHDIANHCTDGILVQNARPLFFLDYLATSKLNPVAAAAVVQGMAAACRANGCALIGGETAEMPGVYVEGAFDVAGAIVGLVDRAALLPRLDAMRPGDALLGLPSSGPHTNGYSLIRRVVEGRNLQEALMDNRTLADALLAPHRAYVSEVDQLQRAGILIKGMAHVTGGGILENVPRSLPPQLAARIVTKSWTPPLIFQRLVAWAGIPPQEAYRVFNMGIGMVLMVDADGVDEALLQLPEAVVIGRLVERNAAAEPVQLIG